MGFCKRIKVNPEKNIQIIITIYESIRKWIKHIIRIPVMKLGCRIF